MPSARTPYIYVSPAKTVHECRSIPGAMKSRTTCRYGSVAILPNLNLILNRRLHVVRVMASVGYILRAV